MRVPIHVARAPPGKFVLRSRQAFEGLVWMGSHPGPAANLLLTFREGSTAGLDRLHADGYVPAGGDSCSSVPLGAASSRPPS